MASDQMEVMQVEGEVHNCTFSDSCCDVKGCAGNAIRPYKPQSVVKADQLSLVQADQHEAHLIHLKDVSDMKPQPVMKANHPSLVRADQREAHLADQPSLVRADQRDREKANHPSLVRADHREAHLADQPSLVRADQLEAHLAGQPSLVRADHLAGQPSLVRADHLADQPSLVRADHLADQPSLVRADQLEAHLAGQPSLVRADHLADQPSLVRADQLEAHLAGQPSLVRADQRETHLVHHLVPSVEKVRHVHQNLHVISPSHNERHGKSRAQNVSRFPRVSGSDVACLFTKPDAIGTTDEFEESNKVRAGGIGDTTDRCTVPVAVNLSGGMPSSGGSPPS